MEEQLIKLKFILAVGGLTDIFYIIATLKKYELVKQHFVLEMELGQEVFIPKILSCDKYPLSYRFYDPIIQIINQFFSQESKIYYSFKTEFRLDKLRQMNFYQEIMMKLGIIDTEEEKEMKPVHKHQLVNRMEEREILWTKSQHAKQIQKSKYLVIEASE